jgi:hypothetical protein
MRRLFLVGVCALVLAGAATMASAATIQDVLGKTGKFDPTTQNFDLWLGGVSGYALTFDKVDASTNLFDPTGRPGPVPKTGPSGGNPAWLVFDYLGTGSPGTGVDINNSSAHTSSLYNLGTNQDQAWNMDFSVLFYDPAFTGTSVLVVIYDQSGTHRAKEVTIDDQDVKDGYMVTYNIVAAAQESVVVQIISEAGATYAAGFFMKSSTTNIAPEPATLTFLAIGAAALVLRRRRT